MRKMWAALAAMPLLAGNAIADPVSPPGLHDLYLTVQGLRSEKGVLQICVTALPAAFPDCKGDGAARRLSVPASTPGGAVRVAGLAPGRYGVAVIHDANGNARLDTFAGIPREGVGFSRNPALGFGAPRFDSVSFPVKDGDVRQTLRMLYFL